MKLFVVVSSLLAVATAAPSAALYATYAQPATLYAANVAAPAYLAAVPAELQSQYHAQDELGQYSYGYSGAQSAKAESKSFDGITRGSYSYVDAENKLQTVAYTADAVNGFRVAASNLPVAPIETRIAPEPVKETPEVAAATAEHLAAIEEAKLRNAAAEKEDSAEVIAAAAPAAIQAAIPAAIPLPVTAYAAAAPAAPAASFAYSTQSIALKSAEPQPIAYTYAAPAAAAIELKAPSSFAYSTYTHAAPATYTLPATTIQYAAAAPLAYSTTSYAAPIASLPYASQYATFAPAAPIAIAARSQPALAGEIVALPEPVQDTPEVAKAKEEHLQAVAEAKARSLQ